MTGVQTCALPISAAPPAGAAAAAGLAAAATAAAAPVAPKGRFQRPVLSFFKAPATAEEKEQGGAPLLKFFFLGGAWLCGVAKNI